MQSRAPFQNTPGAGDLSNWIRMPEKAARKLNSWLFFKKRKLKEHCGKGGMNNDPFCEGS
jgi:hypothetical protein